MRQLIQGGAVFLGEFLAMVDLLVVDGKIAKIGRDFQSSDADATLDASGCWVLPGGIDVHTHLEWSWGGTTTVDDMVSGTRAAVCGGTTTVANFIQPPVGQPFAELLAHWKEKAQGSWCDYGFHAIVSEARPDWLSTLPVLREEGVGSIKVFTAYPGSLMMSDADLFQVMRAAKAAGILTMVHAENGPVIDVIAQEAIDDGKYQAKYHGLTRPPILEGEAVFRVGELARVADAPVYIVHLSSEEALAALRMVKGLGADINAETCPQYLFLDDRVYTSDDFSAAKYVYTPPSRSATDTKTLLGAVLSDDVNIVSSDHCPFDFMGAKQRGVEDFRKIPNGGPGIETRVPMTLEAVFQGRIPLNKAARAVSTNAAKQFGLFPKKGALAPGSDADLIVVDYEHPRTRVIAQSGMHHRVDYTPFEGFECRGFPRDVMVGGQWLVRNGKWAGGNPHGTFAPMHAVSAGDGVR